MALYFVAVGGVCFVLGYWLGAHQVSSKGD